VRTAVPEFSEQPDMKLRFNMDDENVIARV